MTAPRGTEAGGGSGSTGSPDARWGAAPPPQPEVTADGWTTPEAATAEPDALPDPPAEAAPAEQAPAEHVSLSQAARELADRTAGLDGAPAPEAGPAEPPSGRDAPAAQTSPPTSATSAYPGPGRTAAGPSSGAEQTDAGPRAAGPAGPRDPGDLPPAVPRAGRAVSPTETSGARPAWAPAAAAETDATTVLPGGRAAQVPRPAPARPAPPRAGSARSDARPAAARPGAARTRRARLALRRLDPWSVFVFSLVASLFVGVALVVAVAVLYAVLGSLGVTQSLNQLFAEVTGGSASGEPLITGSRVIGGAAVLAAVNVVFLTLLATLGSLLYNLCASFTGGIELTLGERD